MFLFWLFFFCCWWCVCVCVLSVSFFLFFFFLLSFSFRSHPLEAPHHSTSHSTTPHHNSTQHHTHTRAACFFKHRRTMRVIDMCFCAQHNLQTRCVLGDMCVGRGMCLYIADVLYGCECASVMCCMCVCLFCN